MKHDSKIHFAFRDKLTSFNELFKEKRILLELVIPLLLQLYLLQSLPNKQGSQDSLSSL